MQATTLKRRGFTLIELVAVMVVLAVLAGVAIPRYLDYAGRAKTSAVEGTLGGVRAGLANFYTDSIIEGNAAYPTHAELLEIGTVMQDAIPKNPFNNLSEVQQIGNLAAAQSRTVSNTTTYGWNYFVDNTTDPPVAIFWANTDDETTVLDNAGEPRTANEL
ncbi:MAG: prepilin-type N-terminal cleavage/methylation domain-containing protein [Planctomycetota bacterium]|nr:prepilin-type N-terminal cleavage/methylation domain-containing protein [Planctomycetota bacterium]